MAKESKNKRHFLKDVKAELKKVVWPTPKQLIKNTLAVIVIVIITAVIVFVLDLIFETATTKGIDQIKSQVLERRNLDIQDANIVDKKDEKTEITDEENQV